MRVTGGVASGVGNNGVADIDGDSKPDAIQNIYVFRNKLGEHGAWAGKDTTICSGQTVRLGIYNYAPGFIFSWTSNPAGFTSTTSDPLVNPSVTTTYYLSVTNPQGCTTNDTIKVTLGGPAPVANAGPDASLCIGSSIQLGTAATGSNTYLWTSNPGGYLSLIHI